MVENVASAGATTVTLAAQQPGACSPMVEAALDRARRNIALSGDSSDDESILAIEVARLRSQLAAAEERVAALEEAGETVVTRDVHQAVQDRLRGEIYAAVSWANRAEERVERLRGLVERVLADFDAVPYGIMSLALVEDLRKAIR
jgi:phage shock protein A